MILPIGNYPLDRPQNMQRFAMTPSSAKTLPEANG
jgi:hypothetical protein